MLGWRTDTDPLFKTSQGEKINGPIQAMNWREKFTNIVGDYEREIYVWMGGGEREGASSSSGC